MVTCTARVSSWIVTFWISEVLRSPLSSRCSNLAEKSLNLPCRLEIKFHCADCVAPGAMLPRSTVSDGVPAWLPTCELTILKSISRPFSFSMILGCAEVMVRSPAPPLPTLVTCRPSANGSLASTASVKGSSPITSRCQK